MFAQVELSLIMIAGLVFYTEGGDSYPTLISVFLILFVCLFILLFIVQSINIIRKMLVRRLTGEDDELGLDQMDPASRARAEAFLQTLEKLTGKKADKKSDKKKKVSAVDSIAAYHRQRLAAANELKDTDTDTTSSPSKKDSTAGWFFCFLLLVPISYLDSFFLFHRFSDAIEMTTYKTSSNTSSDAKDNNDKVSLDQVKVEEKPQETLPTTVVMVEQPTTVVLVETPLVIVTTDAPVVTSSIDSPTNETPLVSSSSSSSL
jgi:hypothetical protein